MLRGNHLAKIDDKGRLKIPAHFRHLIEEKHGPNVFVTSVTGKNALIYPLDIWQSKQEELRKIPSSNKAAENYRIRTNYFGGDAEIDNQGRILIPSVLRKESGLTDDVSVLGDDNFLRVWKLESMDQYLRDNPYTDELADQLSEFGF